MHRCIVGPTDLAFSRKAATATARSREIQGSDMARPSSSCSENPSGPSVVRSSDRTENNKEREARNELNKEEGKSQPINQQR